jgi:hypothetical protein
MTGSRLVVLLVLMTQSLVSSAATQPQPQPQPQMERIAIVVGSNAGSIEDEPLRFAESDARRFRDVLLELGAVRPDRASLVFGGGPDQVLHALLEARGRAAELQSSGHHVMLIFYYSGHGDDESLHLPKGSLPLAQLRSELAHIPAELRISFLDACRTGGRNKGVRRGPAFALATLPDEPRGTVELRASALGEAAQESEDLSGAVFTHFLLSGLRGAADVDGDRRVTLAELYAYCYRRTLMRTGSGPVLQHPAMAIEIAGTGEVVLSNPATASAAIEVPGGADRYLVFSMPSAAVMGEVSGEGEGRLALPAGKFLVVRRGSDRTGVAMVDLSWGGTQRLRNSDFHPVAREELIARGGRIELRPWRISPLTGVEFEFAGAEGSALCAGLALAYYRGQLGFEIEGAYVGGPVATPGFAGAGWEHSMVGSPSLVGRLFRGRLTMEGSLGVELRYSWEILERTNPSRYLAAGFSSTERKSFGSMGPRTGARLAISAGHNLTVLLAASFSALFRRETNSFGSTGIAFHPAVLTTVGLGYAF